MHTITHGKHRLDQRRFTSRYGRVSHPTRSTVTLRGAVWATVATAAFLFTVYAVGVLTAPVVVTVTPTPDPTVLQACSQAGCPTSPDAMNGRTVTYACISRNYCPARY